MRPTPGRPQTPHPSYPPNGPQSLPPWHAAAATVTKVWDWSGAVTQPPTSDCYAYAQGQPMRSSGLGPGGAPGCMPVLGARLFLESRLRESAQGDKWSFCLTAGKFGPRIRREHEQETAPEPCIGL